MRPAAAALSVSLVFASAASAEPVEYVFVLRDQSVSRVASDDRLVAMQDQTEAECRFETNKAAAAAGHIVVPGSSGFGFTPASPLGRGLSNLQSALTATSPTVVPGMSSAQMWQFFTSCFEAKGYHVLPMSEFERAKEQYNAAHPSEKLKGVAKTFDFQ